MADVIIVLVLVVIVLIALKSTRKHMKGESSCCGGGGEIYQALEDKKLDNPIIKENVFKKVLRIKPKNFLPIYDFIN